MPRKKTSEDTSSINETMDGQEQSPEVVKGESSKGKSETAKPGGIWLPTGSTVLDLVVGAGRGLGHEAGQVINLVSESQGGKCITDGLILTDRGLHYLSELIDPYGEGYHNASYVLLGADKEKVMTSHVYKEFTDNTYRIETKRGVSIEGTPEHKVMVQRGGERILVRLDELDVGDSLVYCVGTNMYGTSTEFNHRPGTDPRRKKGKLPTNPSKELAEFLGYFVADGTFPTKRCIRISNSQTVVQMRVSTLAQYLFGVTPHTEKDKIEIFSTDITEFVKYLIGNPKRFTAHYKYVPSFILHGEKEIQQSFLRAYLDCDGGMSKGREYEFCTASKRLFEEVRAMLVNMGMFCACSLREGADIKSKHYDHTYYRGFLRGVWFRKYIQEIGTINSQVEFYSMVNHDWKEIEDTSIVLLEISDIQHNTTVQKAVYDVTVPGDHLFISVGFINHNTALVNEAIANAYWRFGDKFKWEYDSTCENGNTFDTKKLYGFDIIPKKGATRSKTIQDAFGNIMSFLKNLKSDEFGIYALDSVDAVVSDEIEEMSEERLKAFEKGKDFDKGSYQGQKAKFLSSEFLPQITDLAETKNCLIILISQLRDNIGGGNYAPKDKIAGGRALLFYCSSRIWLKTKAAIEVSGREIGVIVQADTRKARGPRPYRKGNYIFYYEYGIDDIGGNIDFLYGLRTEAKAEFVKDAEKQALSWDGKTFTRKELIKYIEDNGQAQELREAVITMWDKIEEEANKEVSERKRRF